METKTCPRCGQVLFSDMAVCYGCLYDFRRCAGRESDGTGRREPPLPAGSAPVRGQEGPALVPAPSQASSGGPGPSDGTVTLRDIPPIPMDIPRTRVQTFTDDDLMSVPTTVLNVSEDHGGLGLRVRSEDMEVTIPLPEDGLLIGRGNVCDVILHSRAVSRHHVRIVPQGNGAVVRDCGATNLAILNGSKVADSVRMGVGETLDVCGTYFTLLDGYWR